MIELHWACHQLFRKCGSIWYTCTGSIRGSQTYNIQLLFADAPEFLPEHSGHELQSFHLHFLVQDVCLLGHHDSHAVKSGWRVVDLFLDQRSSWVSNTVPAHNERGLVAKGTERG